MNGFADYYDAQKARELGANYRGPIAITGGRKEYPELKYSAGRVPVRLVPKPE